MKYILVALFAGLAGLLSHGSVQADLTQADYTNMDIVQHITYMKDHRTGICFAKYYVGHMEYTIGGVSAVPCEHVLPLLRNP